MVAGFISERWPTSNRNTRPASLGIRDHGDAINVLLVAAEHNIRLILNWMRIFCAFIRALLMSSTEDPDIQYRRSTLA